MDAIRRGKERRCSTLPAIGKKACTAIVEGLVAAVRSSIRIIVVPGIV